MELNDKLITLLTQYIEHYKELREQYKHQRTNQTLYEELLETLNNNLEDNKINIAILLNVIYNNDIYEKEFYRVLLQANKKEELKQFIDKINADYLELKHKNRTLKNRLDRNFQMFESAKRVRICLKYQTLISNSQNDIFNVKRIISYNETSGIISNKEELLLINIIESHNRNVAVRKGSTEEEKAYANNLYNEIPYILTIGFQEHDEIEVAKDRKEALDKFVNEIINLINYVDIEQIEEVLDAYKKYNLDHNEHNYIIVRIMDTYLEELITLYELLVDKEVYTHRAGRIDVIKHYYKTLEKYITTREYYVKRNEYQEETTEIKEENESVEPEEEKILIYSRSDSNITKAKIISDMSDIPYEYYDNIYDLLIKFKNGTLGSKRIKTILVGNKNLSHLELKDDNIRIVLKRVKDNIYNVLGVFIKKANNDRDGYRNITNRMTPDISTEEKLQKQLELSSQTEQELTELVTEKARKNGRK